MTIPAMLKVRMAGLMDVVIGSAFLASTGLVVTGIPSAVEQWSREPEDIWILAMLFPTMSYIAVTCLVAGVALIRARAFGWISPYALSVCVGTAGALLLAISSLGFLTGGVDALELRLMLIPAIAVGWSSLLVKRLPLQR